MKKLLFLDCDSTLCAIEGVDELAALRGPEIEQKVIELTNQAMDGTVPIDEVFARRLDLIQPTRAMCDEVAQMYINRLSPNVETVICQLQEDGWETIIISGGFTQVIEPVAAKLGIQKIFAVGLNFNEAGNFEGFDAEAPTARNGGKPEIIQSVIGNDSSTQSVMVGDGISDLETDSVVNLFVGYGGVVSRKSVQKKATAFITDFCDLPKVMKNHL